MGDLYELYEDRIVHSECVPSPQPWETHVAPATSVLKRLTDQRGWLMDCMYQDREFQLNDLPERIAESALMVVAAENKLRCLLEDITDEHRDLDRERLDLLKRRGKS